MFSRIVAAVNGIEVREIGEDELDTLAAAVNEVVPRSEATREGYVDWRRQAADMVWLLAERDGRVAGGGMALVGWHSPPELGLGRAFVLRHQRDAGVGTALLRALSAWAGKRGATELEGEIEELDAESVAWAARRGFREVGRNSRLVLDLERITPPAADPPPGIEIVPWSEKPEAAQGMYEVALEATRDIPGNEEDELGTFEAWLSRDMQGISDRPQATFVALADGAVVGFAKLSFSPSRERAYHDLTGVRRAWRGRGIAAALKRTQIAWAKRDGYRQLVTSNEVRNEPIRRLNERYGYVVEPGAIVVRGPLSRDS